MTDYLKIAEECGGMVAHSVPYLMLMNDYDLARFAERVRGVPEGWKLVPNAATQEMQDAGRLVFATGSVPLAKLYHAMLAATPCPPAVSDQAAEIEFPVKAWAQEVAQERDAAEESARIERGRRLIAEQERDGLREALELVREKLFAANNPEALLRARYYLIEEARELADAALAAHPKAEPQEGERDE